MKRKRSKTRRVRGRERLYGKAKEARRREIFERSGGRCEARYKPYSGHAWQGRESLPTWRCNAPITWETMEWSHKRHGANKDDSLEGGIASCRECHQKAHNCNGKPVPAKEPMVSLHRITCDCQRCKERKDARAKSD